jgi:DNA-binding SARP family transcriptional activator/RecA/RadA recombinase
MEFRVLGPLEVAGASGAVTPGGRKLRALLAQLLLNANEPVSAERLAIALWGEDAPPSSVKTIHVHVSRLRKALGDPGVIATTPAGYVLHVGPGELDAQEFDRLVAEGRALLADGHPDRAAARLREALRLCRGPPLPEFASEPFAQPEIARLEDERLDALEARVDADLRCGRHADVVAELSKLADLHPTREHLAGQLMLALYRCGRHADALAVFQRARARLDEQLGLDPASELTTLQRQILEQAPALEPPAAHAVATARTGADAAPLPPPLGRARSMPYVGRRDEHALLRDAIEHAGAGTTRIVLIGGEPGIGKTRLAAAAALEAHAAGFAVGWGGSSEGVRAPYGTWITALSHLAEHAPDAVLAPVLRTHGRHLSRLLPPPLTPVADSAPPSWESDPETERYLLFTAVVGLLEALAARQPVAIVLDDLQWSDTPSLTLLRHVVEATGQVPLLLVVTYRDTETRPDERVGTVLTELLRVDGVERLVLGGLGVADITTMMTEMAGHPLGAAGRRLAAEIREETGGNAFFVGQVLRHLSESGAIAQDDAGRWEVRATLAEIGVPGTVRDVVLQRVARLGEPAQSTLTLAAVIGRSFDLELLQRLTDADPLPALESALEASVVTEPAAGRFAFAHGIINHALASQLSGARRSRLHCQVATAIAELPGDHVAEIAHHWLAAGSTAHADEAIHWALRAGDRALEQLAPDEAIRWFGEGLRLADGRPEHPQRYDLLIGLGEARRQVGAPFRDILLEASALAERHDDHEQLARAVLANTLGPFGAAGPRDEARVAALRRALAAVPEQAPSRARIMAVLGKEVYYGGDPAEGTRLADEALTLARRTGDRRELGRVMAFTTAISPIAPFERHAALVDELAGIGDSLDDPELRFRAANAGFILAMHSGDRPRLDASLEAMLALADAIGQPILRWTALWAHSARRCLAGQLGEATRLTGEAAELAREHGISDGQVITFGQLVAIRGEQGRLDELVEPLDRHIAANPELRLLRLTRGFIDAETGRLTEAAEVLERQRADGFGFAFDRTRAFNLARCADIAMRLAARDVAGELYERLLPYRRQFATPAGISSRGSIELNLGRLAGLLGHVDGAVEHFAAAEAAHLALDAPLLLARTFVARGAWLKQLGGHEQAAAAEVLLTRGLTLARRHGSAAIEREAMALGVVPVDAGPTAAA